MFKSLKHLARDLLGSTEKDSTPEPTIAATDISPIERRVLMIVHDPPVAARGGKRLTEIFGWHDPARLAEGYSADLREVSGGYLNYKIAERIDADWFPVKKDGFRYDGESYLRAWETREFHQPDAIDYEAQVRQFDLLNRHDRGDFDEVWFFSFPYAGDYESTMAGPGAFWCNSPPVPNTEGCRRRLVMMGFNYEREVDTMLENFGHRTESIMTRVYETLSTGENYWQRFTRYDKTSPGQAECGNVHFAPNSDRDYDWGNPRPVPSRCDDWLTFPNLPGKVRTVTCAEWGNGDMRLHHRWWLSHLPKAEGVTNGVSNNWWRYVIELDPNI
jgi:hypothetical protein